MRIRHLLLKDEPDEIVRLRYDDSPIAKKPDGVEPVSADGKVYMCPACYQDGGSLLTCLSTLTSASEAVYFCCTGLGVTSTGRYPASCPAKPGLSSSEPFRLFSRDYLAWLRKCYSSTFFCTCKEISFITVHSVLSNVAKIHFKLPAAMEFWLVCLGILAYSCQNTSRDSGV